MRADPRNLAIYRISEPWNPRRRVSSRMRHDARRETPANPDGLAKDFGGKFISYDMEKWIFHVPHFNGIQVARRSGTPTLHFTGG